MFYGICGFAWPLKRRIIRLELATPQGDLVSSDVYNRLFTMHGVVMVWFFLIPSIPTTFGNFMVPLMIGARDLAFPRLNLASWYLYVAGGIFTIAALLLGGVDTGWTFYTPYSTMFSNTHVIAVVTGVYQAGDRITGSFAVSSINTVDPPNGCCTTILSYSFTDGHQTFTEGNSTASFLLGRGVLDGVAPNGQNVPWDISISTPAGFLRTVDGTDRADIAFVGPGLDPAHRNNGLRHTPQQGVVCADRSAEGPLVAPLPALRTLCGARQRVRRRRR